MTEPAAKLPATRPEVIPHHAASLLVLRHRAEGGPEILMGLRGANHKFMPNRLVFPGGRVDAADHRAAHASDLRPHVLRALARSAEGSLPRAIAIAAARELEEETGLTLGLPPELLPLDYLARAITPPPSPIRFDARFLLADAEHVTGTLAGSGELEDLRWYGMDDALSLDLALPTRGVLLQLREWLGMSAAQREDRALVPTLRNRGWELE